MDNTENTPCLCGNYPVLTIGYPPIPDPRMLCACGASGPYGKTPQDAIDGWNKIMGLKPALERLERAAREDMNALDRIADLAREAHNSPGFETLLDLIINLASVSSARAALGEAKQ